MIKFLVGNTFSITNSKPKSVKIFVLTLLGFIGIMASASFGSPMADSADAFSAGQWSLTAFGSHVETDPVVEVSGASGITVPTASGSTTIFSQTNAEIEMEAEEESAVLMATFRPRDGLHYRFKIGQIRSYEIEFASGPLTNSFESLDSGILWGAGLRWNGTQDTFVTAAVALDLSYTRREIDLDRFQSGSTVSSANYEFVQDEFQAAINVSRRFQFVEPYGGLKIFRLSSKLIDKANSEKVRGDQDGVSPFLGVAFTLFNNERFFLEGSFVDETSFSAGMSLRI